MTTRTYEDRRDGILRRLELHDDGSFVFTEEEDRIHGSGAGARGRWEQRGTVLSLHVTTSSFQQAWPAGGTEHATCDGEQVTIAGAALRLRS